MLYEVNKLPAKIVIGKAGENLFTEVSIDIKPWAKEYPNATYAIVYMRSDGSTYPVAVANQGNVVTWLPTATDLVSGYGKLEVRMYDGEVIAKSVVIATYVSPSLEVGEFPDDKAPDWVQEIIDAYKGKGSLVAKADLDGDSIYYGEDGKVHSKGGGGGTIDAYTKAETDALLEGKADQGEIEEVTAEISEIKQSIVDVSKDVEALKDNSNLYVINSSDIEYGRLNNEASYYFIRIPQYDINGNKITPKVALTSADGTINGTKVSALTFAKRENKPIVINASLFNVNTRQPEGAFVVDGKDLTVYKTDSEGNQYAWMDNDMGTPISDTECYPLLIDVNGNYLVYPKTEKQKKINLCH